MDNWRHIADAGFLIGQTTVGLHCVRATLKSPIRHQTFLAANPLRLAVARRQARHPPIWGHSGSEWSPGWSCFNDQKNPSASHRTTGKSNPHQFDSIWMATTEPNLGQVSRFDLAGLHWFPATRIIVIRHSAWWLPTWLCRSCFRSAK